MAKMTFYAVPSLSRTVLLLTVSAFLSYRFASADGPFSAPAAGVLLVPGIAGSGLMATLDNAKVLECSSKPIYSSRSRIWASIIEALPPFSRQLCWASKIALEWKIPKGCLDPYAPSGTSIYSEAYYWTREMLLRIWKMILYAMKRLQSITSNQPSAHGFQDVCEPYYGPKKGVKIEVDRPGSTWGCSYLDYVNNFGVFGTKYMHDLVANLQAAGYVNEVTLLGHPFDWRLPVWQLDYESLKISIETFRRTHNNSRITIIGHSLGAAMINYFLTQVVTDPQWKHDHVESFISIAGAYGGSYKSIRSLLSGYGDATAVNFFGVVDISIMPPLVLRRAHRTFGSMYSLTPNLNIFDREDKVITVRIPANGTGRSTPAPISTTTTVTSTRSTTTTAPSDGWTIYGCPINRRFFSCIFGHGSSTVLQFEPRRLRRTSHAGSYAKLETETEIVSYMRRRALSEASLHDHHSSFSRKDTAPSLNVPASSRQPMDFHDLFTDENQFHFEESSVNEEQLQQPAWPLNDEQSPFRDTRSNSGGDLSDNDNWVNVTFTLTDWWKLLPLQFQSRAIQAQARIGASAALLGDPGVPVACLWSRFDHPTTEAGYSYDVANIDAPPRMKLAHGDNTLLVESASYCKHWQSTLWSNEFVNLDHMTMLFDPNFLDTVVTLVVGRGDRFGLPSVSEPQFSRSLGSKMTEADQLGTLGGFHGYSVEMA